MGDLSLATWMRTLIGYVRSGSPDLTNRQMALLLVVYLTPGPHTVRGLAQTLGVSKPVITRALNTLGGLGYLRRERDQDDRRNIFIVRTNDGADFLDEFRQLFRAQGGNGGIERDREREREREREYQHGDRQALAATH
ncbi:MarR family transcriptional regulator [Sphingomicrobium astaxanthinifaciens]|uniref:MarR family transcriptional regulator n=1 Tax=Sphingomicrobium astaxanthinifaciens TaxID=1227949 RepID=UPI001FCAEB20|nr:MarR family winged helix-turn-helix transcriptional regulator [Sphingomicrobium astaxanthinifaciens]MCJ7422021.1 MarR family transcriptional regulator [Sphingomicrobium astaxanthinifaciens]